MQSDLSQFNLCNDILLEVIDVQTSDLEDRHSHWGS